MKGDVEKKENVFPLFFFLVLSAQEEEKEDRRTDGRSSVWPLLPFSLNNGE